MMRIWRLALPSASTGALNKAQRLQAEQQVRARQQATRRPKPDPAQARSGTKIGFDLATDKFGKP